MSDTYTPPKVWTWDKPSGGKFASINRPVAGATHDKELPRGKHPLQLYSLATPNGVKVTVLLEELLALGKRRLAARYALKSLALQPTQPISRRVLKQLVKQRLAGGL